MRVYHVENKYFLLSDEMLSLKIAKGIANEHFVKGDRTVRVVDERGKTVYKPTHASTGRDTQR